MKNKSLMLLVLAAGLLVTSCGRQNVSSVDSVVQPSTSEVGDSSSNSNSTSSADDNNSQTSSSEARTMLETWKDNDYNQMLDCFELTQDVIGDLPFPKCYDYVIDTDNEGGYIDFETEEAQFAPYIEKLTQVYGTPFTEDYLGNTRYDFLLDGTIYLSVSGFVYKDGKYYIEMSPYDASQGGSEAYEDISDYSFDYTTIGQTLEAAVGTGTYPKTATTYTVNDVTFETGSKFGLVAENDQTASDLYDYGTFQLKANDNNAYLKNTTELTNKAEKVVIVGFVNSSYATPNYPSLLAGHSANNLTKVNGVLNEEQFIEKEVGNFNYFYLEFTLTEAMEYIKVANDSKGAKYIYGIYINPTDIVGLNQKQETGKTKLDPVTPTLPEDTDGTGLKKVTFNDKTYKDVHDLAMYQDGMPTKGDVKVLVIPVDFSDQQASEKGYTIATLEKAFNGTGNDTSYYSLHDYFYASSYGQLNLDFDIHSEWLRMPKTFADYDKDSRDNVTSTDVYGHTGKDSMALTEQTILNEALKMLDAKGMDLSQYDSDKNGTIDSVVIINAGTIDDNAKGLGWAWRYWNYLADTSKEDKENGGYDYYTYDGVYANDYLWCSYQFLYESVDEEGKTSFTNTSKVNTYTFIHEYSHVLGADDYYDTSYIREGAESPLQTLDEMDGCAADHNAYTKMFLGWITDSQLITTRGEIEVTLDAFETSKQTYIISNTWDDSKGQFQEFWVLEYNSKTGLNASIDGKGLFNDKSGLVIYHVNNELQIETENGEEYAGIKYSNTSGNGTPVDLISFADSEHLIYTVGESTSLDIDDDHSNKIPYQITVVSENDGKLTLKIVYQTPTTTEAE